MQSVAYLGPPASYSHQATLNKFPTKTHEHIACITIPDIFEHVQSGKTTYGVVPFENSTNGSVVLSLDLFCDRDNRYSSVRVHSETYLDVHHCLLGHPRPLVSPTTVSRIYSHPQAFGQCEEYLTRHLKGVERVDVSSTSKAAHLVASDPTAVAIASAIAADVESNVAILASNIEDVNDNTTRFLIITSSDSSAISRPSPTGTGDKTFLSFTIDHEQPGALCDVLKVYKDYKLNLTSLASRPSKVTPWEYIFFVEFEGHEEDERTKKALTEMRRYCAGLRVLGSYKNRQHERRRSSSQNGAAKSQKSSPR